MKRAITILSIVLIVFVFGFIELYSVRNTLKTMETIIQDYHQEYRENQDDITIFYDGLGNVKEFWEQEENWLCFLFNHRDLSVITDSINRLQAYTLNNDYDNAISELELLKEYFSSSYHLMGFNIHNIL